MGAAVTAPRVTVNLGPTIAMLGGIQERARDLRPFLAGDLTNEVHEFFADQFATSGAAGGEPWAPLSPRTLAFKRRYGRAGMGTLRFTNQLWASLTKRGHPLGRRQVTATSLAIGSNDPKAAKHQEGRGDAGQNLPRRVLVPDPMPTDRVDRWAALTLRYVEGA